VTALSEQVRENYTRDEEFVKALRHNLERYTELLAVLWKELKHFQDTLIDMLPLEKEIENIERIGYLLKTTRDLIQTIEKNL